MNYPSSLRKEFRNWQVCWLPGYEYRDKLSFSTPTTGGNSKAVTGYCSSITGKSTTIVRTMEFSRPHWNGSALI
jgi:hypothetical protein